MQFKATAKFIQCSPYKLRLLVDAVRKKNVKYALDWLATYPARRAIPIGKVIKSAAANAKDLQGINPEGLVIKDLRVDQGPIFKYYKPGAMGRSVAQRKRFSHISVTIESNEKEA